MNNILFIQGGAGQDDHNADAKLVDSLKKNLGKDYKIHYPLLPEESSPDFGRPKQIGRELNSISDEVILVGHSLGASMLLKYLSESKITKNITGIFLISTPFWSGDEDWKQGLRLQADFAHKLPKDVPIFLYHSPDDEEVPFEQLESYITKLPGATVRKTEGGHQLNNDLSVVAEDIKSLYLKKKT